MARTESPVFNATVNRLRDLVGTENLIDVGYKAATPLGVSPSTLQRAVKHLHDDEGFSVIYMPLEQRANGKRAIVKILAPKGLTFGDVYYRRGQIKAIEKEKV